MILLRSGTSEHTPGVYYDVNSQLGWRLGVSTRAPLDHHGWETVSPLPDQVKSDSSQKLWEVDADHMH
jgi:hypothetical protein